MKHISTRNNSKEFNFSEVFIKGLADNGGLYVPQSLTKYIKKNNPTPIILLTAKGETEDRIRGLELGADDYLGKPFEPKELLLRIKNILNKTKLHALPEKIYVGKTLINLKKSNILNF